VGRKAGEKGYQLIESVARVLENSHPGIEFYFAGPFEKKEDGNRHYLGYIQVEQMTDVYAKMDALILPSQSEGFPNVVVEAMASGIPCIISEEIHCGFFRHKENALLTKRDMDSLKKNILSLYENPELYANLRAKSIEISDSDFDIKYWGAKYREIILGDSELGFQTKREKSLISSFFTKIKKRCVYKIV
jgi:glycosyltransferase involved in cell wall biosynthesis